MRSRDWRFSARALALAAVAVVFATGCHHRGENFKAGPEIIYRQAQKSMHDGDFANAIKQLDAIEARFPFSAQAHQAQIDLIYANYENRQTHAAIDAANTFIRENPTNVRVDYAYYMKGLIYFSRQRNFIERYFKVDLSARPPENSQKSFEAFALLLQKFPRSPYAPDARQRMIYLRNRLANFEIHVADYYMRRGAYVAAIDRAKYCVSHYDGAPAVQHALLVMIAAYKKLHMPDLAASVQKVYDLNFAGTHPAPLPRAKKHWRLWKFW